MNLPHRVIIVDDEPPARDIIEVFVNRFPDFSCVATCGNVMQAVQAVNRFKADLIFLDIQMPEMTGIDFLNLNLTVLPDVILTTAFPEFALKSYDYSVLDYLVKPVGFDRFSQAIVKYINKKEKELKSEKKQIEGIVGNKEHDLFEAYNKQIGVNSVWLREEKRLLQIPYDDILFVEGMKDYIKVYTKTQMIMTHLSIGKAEELFPSPSFIRIHRSHLVRSLAIQMIDGNTLTLINGTKLLIGPNYKEELKKYIRNL